MRLREHPLRDSAKQTHNERKKVKTFKLLEGTHYEHGTKYEKGALVKSSINLEASFPNKFTLVHDAQPTLVRQQPAKAEKPTNKTAPVASFEDGDDTRDGEEQESDAEHEGNADFDGEDVTSSFKGAKDGNLKVFQTAKGFNVVDLDDKEAGTQNDKPLKTKAAVKSFIKDYLG